MQAELSNIKQRMQECEHQGAIYVKEIKTLKTKLQKDLDTNTAQQHDRRQHDRQRLEQTIPPITRSNFLSSLTNNIIPISNSIDGFLASLTTAPMATDGNDSVDERRPQKASVAPLQGMSNRQEAPHDL